MREGGARAETEPKPSSGLRAVTNCGAGGGGDLLLPQLLHCPRGARAVGGCGVCGVGTRKRREPGPRECGL